MKIKNDYNTDAKLGFEFMFSNNKNWFSPREVAKMLGCSDQYVRNCIYAGKLFAHVASRENEAGDDVKSYIRIHRQGIEMYLLETANYTNDTFFEKITQILARRNSYELMRIESFIKETLYKTQNSRKAISSRQLER
ncbi:MAG: helix-turn-helix domain-containing protein [Opitutales bacterium]